MKTTDKQILETYLKGYEDESFGTTSFVPDNIKLVEAYELGVSHVLSSRKYNVMDPDEILKNIKK